MKTAWLVVMMMNGWGPQWKAYEFPNMLECRSALASAKIATTTHDMKGNHFSMFCTYSLGAFEK